MPEEIKFRADVLPLNRRHLFATGLSAVIGSMVWPSYLVGREALITPLWARILRASIAAANDDSLDSRVVAEARHMLQTVRHSHYQHHTHIDPAMGTYDCDCSELSDMSSSRSRRQIMRSFRRRRISTVPAHSNITSTFTLYPITPLAGIPFAR